MKHLFATILVCAFVFAAQLRAAPQTALAPQTFLVKSVSGDVYVWGHQLSRWLTVRSGAELQRGSLIQVSHGATVSLESRSGLGFRGVKSGRTVFTINTPLVMRLDEHSLRPVEMDKRFLIPDPSAGEEPNTSEPKSLLSRFDLSDAWTRIAAMMTRGGRHGEKDDQQIMRSDLSIAVAAKRLTLLAPQPDALIYSPGRPVDLRVIWKSVTEKDATYFVYLWKTNEDRSAPLVKTKGDYHTVSVRDEGRYFVQVTTADGEWQSPAHLVYVHRKLPSGLAFEEGLAATEPQIRLVFPPNDFIAMTPRDDRGPQDVLTLAWQGRIPNRSEVTYNVVVLDTTSGKTLIERKTDKDRITVDLPAGHYSWRVSTSIEDKSSITTPSRSFEVFSANQKNAAGMLKTLLSHRESGVFVYPGH